MAAVIRQTEDGQLIKQKIYIMLIHLLHCPAVGLLQPLIVEQQILVRRQVYSPASVSPFGRFTNLAKV